MIRNKSELQVGKTLVNEKKYFKHPIDFYLNKRQFSIKKD